MLQIDDRLTIFMIRARKFATINGGDAVRLLA